MFIYELWYDFIHSTKKLIKVINEKNQSIENNNTRQSTIKEVIKKLKMLNEVTRWSINLMIKLTDLKY